MPRVATTSPSQTHLQARFLLGPAGSGKTWRCLAEIRSELLASVDGPRLILLAPKQATYQLERQLLADEAVPGYTRLLVLSFERLADFILLQASGRPAEYLDEEGRVMVLRALLARHQARLGIFRATARLPGLARQLSQILRDLRRHRVGSGRLAEISRRTDLASPLRDKLQDLALLAQAYEEWLGRHRLQDADSRLDLAAACLERPAPGDQPHSAALPVEIGGVWLDGFAEMTPQEIHLLVALLRHGRRATLAFCLETEPREALPWLSAWSVVSHGFRAVQARVAAIPGANVEVETLARRADRSRFARSPALAQLESSWTRPPDHRVPPRCEPRLAGTGTGSAAGGDPPAAVRLVECPDREAEAQCAAHEIRRWVRERGARFRDVAVLLRSFEGYHDILRRAFRRLEIPFFLDRRESVTHHPLAELTRFALRIVAYRDSLEDWLGALKSGLAPATDDEIDELETAARAHGWAHEMWYRPQASPSDQPGPARCERIRQRVVPPFRRLAERLTRDPAGLDGARLAEALRALWRELGVERAMARWSQPPAASAPRGATHSLVPTASEPDAEESVAERGGGDREAALSASGPHMTASPPSLHATVWEQVQTWLGNLERGFRDVPLPLREWLPVIEAGLSGLTVGVVPPALDQVLIGTVDRSRNPHPRLVLVLGLNESEFPADPPTPVLLNETDLADLERLDVTLGPGRHQRLGQEQYYGYIACTRASEQLIATCAARDEAGRPLNPSPFFEHLQRLAGETGAPPASGGPPGPEAVRGCAESDAISGFEHPAELVPKLVAWQSRASLPEAWAPVLAIPTVQRVLTRAAEAAAAGCAGALSAGRAIRLYGAELRTSITALEAFAACPFKFFVAHGLRAAERKEFRVDARERGSFMHEVLKSFHRGLESEGRGWRDLSAQEAGERVGRIGAELLPAFREGLFERNPAERLAAVLLIEQLQAAIETMVGWMPQYEFDPRAVEIDFGLDGAAWPGWRLDLEGGRRLVLRGRIDRADLCRGGETGEALAVVIDYKSRGRKLDVARLHHGLDLQLLAYLNALIHCGSGRAELGSAPLRAAGAFYVGLRPETGSVSSRHGAHGPAAGSRTVDHQHSGRFLRDALERFDNRHAAVGNQFRYRRKKDGGFDERSPEALPAAEFDALLARNEGFLRQHAQAILRGEVGVRPFRTRKETACEDCDYRSVCRFDPWLHPYRLLAPPPGRSRPATGPARPTLRGTRP